ncbi:hypothetical protein Gohar_011181 [Gossypium harknessii]|uniref:Uncharacterized protein n=1 Tax=Gossypium harknessii TaxID=34285 RepID=A0A7J9GT61_9ROSI|nr:hypothetical protein [Gossypium harknessii]
MWSLDCIMGTGYCTSCYCPPCKF